MADKIYFNGFNGKATKYGVKLSGKADKIIEEIKKHTNAKGYINLEVQPRREPDKYGNTHTIIVDTWEPSSDSKVTPANISGQEEIKDLPF